MIVWSRRLVCVLFLAGVVYALAVWAPSTASGDPSVPTTTSTTVVTVASAPSVDGHGVRWWATRARRNGHDARVLRGVMRAHVSLGARRLAAVSASPDWLVRSFLCIHGFEGSWTDPAAPYFGGVQMDLEFARSYGANFLRAWGTPDRWPPFVQVAVAINAYLSGRGFWPWPNTARKCGLL